MQYTDSGEKPKRCGTYVGKNHANYIYRIRNNARKLLMVDYLGRDTKLLLALRKIPKFNLTMPSTKFPHREIRLRFGVLRRADLKNKWL